MSTMSIAKWLIENARANRKEAEVKMAFGAVATCDWPTPVIAAVQDVIRVARRKKDWTIFVDDPNTAKKRLKAAGIKATITEHASNPEGRPEYFFSVDYEDAERATQLIDDCGIDPIS